MKVIFLDIDGVFNHGGYFITDGFTKSPKTVDGKRNEARWFDPKCVKLFNELIDKTGAYIVVSSSWRIGRDRSNLQELLKAVGIKAVVLDKTGSGFDGFRGQQIKAWIEENNYTDTYVIIDDEIADMFDYEMDRIIHVDNAIGLQRKEIEAAIKILNGTTNNQ